MKKLLVWDTLTLFEVQHIKLCGVYGILHFVSGRVYIGSASHIVHRLRCHLRMLRQKAHHSPKLQNAWNKYGENAFQFVALEFCEEPLLREREQFHLDTHQAWQSGGFNIAPQAFPTHRLSEETRRKKSQQVKAYMRTRKGRAQVLAALERGRSSEESIQKRRKALSGRKQSLESVAKRSAALRGRKFSPEAKARISAALKGKGKSPQARVNMSKAAKRRMDTPEGQAHLKRMWQSSGIRLED